MDLHERGVAGGVRHPWERHRFAFYRGVIESAFGQQPLSVLDVGAGDGWFARELCAAWDEPLDIVLWDSGYCEGDAYEDGLVRVSTQPGRSFDLVLILDVIEHVPDDARFLEGILQWNLAPGGRLLFSVPAWSWLWSSHDERLRHMRRYSPKNARSLLEVTGLRILESGGLFPTLLPIRALQMVRERLGSVPVPGLEGVPRGFRALLVDALLRFDRKLARGAAKLGVELPGLSWWALCAR